MYNVFKLRWDDLLDANAKYADEKGKSLIEVKKIEFLKHTVISLGELGKENEQYSIVVNVENTVGDKLLNNGMGYIGNIGFGYITQYSGHLMVLAQPVLDKVLPYVEKFLSKFDKFDIKEYELCELFFPNNVLDGLKLVLQEEEENKNNVKKVYYCFRSQSYYIPLYQSGVLLNILQVKCKMEITRFLEMDDYFAFKDATKPLRLNGDKRKEQDLEEEKESEKIS